MGVVQEKSKRIGEIVYHTKTFPASVSHELYIEVAAVLPDEILKLIMLPLSAAIAKKRAAMREGKDMGENEAAKQVMVTVQQLEAALETPGVLAKVATSLARACADVPGGWVALVKRVLAQTEAETIRIAPGDAENQPLVGGRANVVTHYDTHFGAGLSGLYEVLRVAFWVLRENFAQL